MSSSLRWMNCCKRPHCSGSQNESNPRCTCHREMRYEKRVRKSDRSGASLSESHADTPHGRLEWKRVPRDTTMSTLHAEVKLMIGSKEARLLLVQHGQIVEDEVWTAPSKVSQTEAKGASQAVFDNLYDFLNYTFNGE